MTLPALTVFSRQGCHLCEELIEELLPYVRGRARVDILDIDMQEQWVERYGVRIPVVELAGRTVCEYRLDCSAVDLALAAVDAG